MLYGVCQSKFTRTLQILLALISIPWQAAEKVFSYVEQELWSAPTTAALWIS